MLRHRWPALTLDVLCVLVFATVGRSSHEERASVAGVLSTAWPFLTGLALAWLLASVLSARWVRVRGRDTDALAVLPWVWTVPLVTWAVGLGLRVTSGQGVSGAFPLVALGFLVVALLGWRAVTTAARALRRNAGVRRAGPPRSAARAPGTPAHGG